MNIGQYRRFAKNATIALIDAELAAQNISVHAGMSESNRRKLLLTSVNGLPSTDPVPGTPAASTTTWTPAPTTTTAEYVFKAIVAFFALQLTLDLAAGLVIGFNMASAISDHEAAVWLTWLISATFVEVVGGFVLFMLPDKWVKVNSRVSRASIAATVIGGAFAIVPIFSLWGADLNRITVVCILWATVGVLTAADAIGLTTAIKKD